MTKKDNKQRLFEIMQRVDPQFTNEGVNFNMLYRPQDYKKKAEELKAEIEFQETDYMAGGKKIQKFV